MVEETKFKLYVFRYIDNVIGGEFVNLAICLVEESDRSARFLGFEAIKDWSRLKSFFPHADVDSLKSWCDGLANDLQRSNGSRELFGELENLSGNIAVTVWSRPLLSDQPPEVEMESQANLYLT